MNNKFYYRAVKLLAKRTPLAKRTILTKHTIPAIVRCCRKVGTIGLDYFRSSNIYIQLLSRKVTIV